MNNFTIPFLMVSLSVFSMGHGQSFISDLEYTDCFLEDCTPFKNDAKVEFARLSLPEDYTNRQGNRVNLAIVILKAKSDHPERDPILFLPGGPGGQTFSRIELFLDHYLREKRDIVLLDFRGIGYSDPEWCPWLQDKLWELITTDITPEMFSQRKIKLLHDCWEELRAQNINPNNYTTPVVVRDLEVLRKALEIDQWNLYGISYGTRVGQAYLRDFPEGIRSVILDSPVPINYPLLGSILDTYREGLDRFFNTCQEDPSCHKAFPTLETDFHRTLESFKDNPLVIPTGKKNPTHLYINFHDFHLTFHQLLYYGIFIRPYPGCLNLLNKEILKFFPTCIQCWKKEPKAFRPPFTVQYPNTIMVYKWISSRLPLMIHFTMLSYTLIAMSKYTTISIFWKWTPPKCNFLKAIFQALFYLGARIRSPHRNLGNKLTTIYLKAIFLNFRELVTQ